MSIQTKEYKSKTTGKVSKYYYAVVFDASNNKTVWSKGYKKIADARREEARLNNDLSNNKSITKSKVKFEEVKDLWISSSRDIYADTTLEGYIWYIKKYIEPIFRDILISDIEPIHIQLFVNTMSETYSAETVNKMINILSNIFKYAIKPLGLINGSPVDGIKRKKVILKKGITWSHDQIYCFLTYEKVIKSIYYELIYTSFMLGARPSEVCGIYEEDLSDKGVLTLERGLNRYGTISDMKSSNSHRSIKLSSEHHKLLINRISKQKQLEIEIGDKYIYNNYLFKQPNGEQVNPNIYSKAFKRLLKAYNKENASKELPDICLYDARHSFATNSIINSDASINTVASVMGNSPRVLISRYVHPTDKAQEILVDDYQNTIFKASKSS